MLANYDLSRQVKFTVHRTGMNALTTRSRVVGQATTSPELACIAGLA